MSVVVVVWISFFFVREYYTRGAFFKATSSFEIRLYDACALTAEVLLVCAVLHLPVPYWMGLSLVVPNLVLNIYERRIETSSSLGDMSKVVVPALRLGIRILHVLGIWLLQPTSQLPVLVVLFSCHFIGDFVLQNDAIAEGKKVSWWMNFVHAVLYTLPFVFLEISGVFLVTWWGIGFIFASHLFFDPFKARWEIISEERKWQDQAMHIVVLVLVAYANSAVWDVVIIVQVVAFLAVFRKRR